MNDKTTAMLTARLEDGHVDQYELGYRHDFLLKTGFRKIDGKIPQCSGVIAIDRSMYQLPVVTDVAFLPFTSLEETAEGYRFGPEDTSAIPVNMWYGKWQGNRVEGVDLFVPKYVTPFLYFSDSLPDYTERDPADLERFEVRKFTRSRESIEEAFPGLCDKLEKFIQPLKMSDAEFEEIKDSISVKLDFLGINHQIKYRAKTVESVFSKAERRVAGINAHVDFTYKSLRWLVEKTIPTLDEMIRYSKDVNGIRVVVNNPEDCYKVLDVLSQKYRVRSIRINRLPAYLIWDSIPFPKRTGFQMVGYFSKIKGKEIHFEIQSEKMQARAVHDGYHLRV